MKKKVIIVIGAILLIAVMIGIGSAMNSAAEEDDVAGAEIYQDALGGNNEDNPQQIEAGGYILTWDDADGYYVDQHASIWRVIGKNRYLETVYGTIIRKSEDTGEWIVDDWAEDYLLEITDLLTEEHGDSFVDYEWYGNEERLMLSIKLCFIGTAEVAYNGGSEWDVITYTTDELARQLYNMTDNKIDITIALLNDQNESNIIYSTLNGETLLDAGN